MNLNLSGTISRLFVSLLTGCLCLVTILASADISVSKALAGNATETEEKMDKAAAETMLKIILECNYATHFMPLRGSREVKVLLLGIIKFKPDGELPVRIKIYRSAMNDGKYSLIYNEVLKKIGKPEVNHSTPQQQTGDKLAFQVTDTSALDCGGNNVFYKIKLCSESGVLLLESKPMRVKLAPLPVVSDDLKTWTWTPFFPGKDSLDGVLQSGQTKIPVSNAPVKGQLPVALDKKNQPNPPIFPFQQSQWQYSGNEQNQRGRFPPSVASTFAGAYPKEKSPVGTEAKNSAVSVENSHSSSPVVRGGTLEVLAGNAMETEEKIDEAAMEAMLKKIVACNCNASLVLQPGNRKNKVFLSGNISFKLNQEQPVRMKIYRSAKNSGKYSLIYNDVLKDFPKAMSGYEESSPPLHFNVADAGAFDYGCNEAFYKVKLYSESGLLLLESNPIEISLVSAKICYWNYNRNDQPGGLKPDSAEVKPVFNGGRFFETIGQVELKSLKIDGRKVHISADDNNAYIYTNGVETRLPGKKLTLNYPGTPVAELEFAYGGSTNTLRVQLPPVPTGLRTEPLENGSVKLTWDALADRIDRRQFIVPPDIKLLRDNKVIQICDINQTEFIDKQTEPGRAYVYSMMLDDARAKVQVWTKERGISEIKTLLRNLETPFPENYKATAYIYPEKPPVRPVRVSFYEPALYYEHTGSSGMRLFSAAMRKLGETADFELLDRASRNNVIEEKVLTMSYEKSIMIKTLPADFTILVRDYSRQQGNGVELWLIQNKTFDYKEVKHSKGWVAPTHVKDDFTAWRIGSISADEFNVIEKTNEIGDKLVTEIKQRVFFKSAVQQKDATAPGKFIFNPLKAVRQQSMVVENEAIGESIMIGLSNQMPGINIMTRNDWKNIFSEQNMIREQGETMDNDISGNVLISGRVWQENNKKQYEFILTDIKTGICVGSLQCSGTVEAVTAQLADACKRIKLPVPEGNELTAQTKSELVGERLTINYAGLTAPRTKYISLIGLIERQKEMNKPEFAEKQWQIGNRENAVKILEEMWETDKSAWEQLKKYHCKMGNYNRAMQIVEAMIQQKDATNILFMEYSRLCAMAARKALPENSITEEADQVNMPAAKIKVSTGTVFENYWNENFNKDYFERLPDWGMEWNPEGKCSSMVRLEVSNELKFEEWFQANTVQSNSVLIKIYENKIEQRTWRANVLWESAPLFGADDTMALSGMMKLFGRGNSGLKIDVTDFEHEKFSRIRAYFEIAKKPEVKLVPVVKFSHIDRFNEEAACNSGRKFLELKLKEIMKKRQEKFCPYIIGRIDLNDMICIDILAQSGNSAAQNLFHEINAIELPSSREELDKLQICNYDPRALLTFKVYQGQRNACDLALKSLRANRYKCYLGDQDNMADIYYLMAKAGRKEIITAMLPVDECEDKDNIAAIRWGDHKMLKSLLLEYPELFKSDVYFYLLDGLNDPDFRNALFYNRHNDLIKSALWLGKPKSELYRELTLKYKSGE
ncbi:MAG: hypothetical protein WCV67_20790 [Victivallaceae bacterium]|jgi:hypothetical protein